MSEQSSHYTNLARRFRPQTFDDVVGQQHVAQALRNAIQAGRVAHAYLFTGTRGVGKTSMARILAKALNCRDVQDGIPCNVCEICQGIAAGHDVDVLEIDGASNRGIDDIRSLRANVNVKSMRTRFKIYIIDEVHMLTKEAFNALLKTLEEPPPTVKFVFCTTEPNKVPDTILSRCQRFDFASIETANIAHRLQQIAESEGFEVEADAVEIVARRAAGSMRDSQSLFDQLLAFGNERITADDVHRLLGTADDDRLFEIADALIRRDQQAVLECFHQAMAQGVQLGELVDQLIGYLRDLMIVASAADNVPLQSVAENRRGSLQQQADQWGMSTIVAALQILAEAKNKMLRANFGRALAELALIRISLLEDLTQLDQLIRSLKSGVIAESSTARRPMESRASDRTPHHEEGAVPANRAPLEYRKPEKKTQNVISNSPSEATNSTEFGKTTVESTKFEAGNEKAIWTQVLSKIPDAISAHLEGVNNLAIFGPNQLALSFPASYHFSKTCCERPEIRAKLEQTVSEVAGRAVQIQFRIEEEDNTGGKQQSSSPTDELSRKKPVAKTVVSVRPDDPVEDPFVQQAMSLFGATVLKVDGITSPNTDPTE